MNYLMIAPGALCTLCASEVLWTLCTAHQLQLTHSGTKAIK